MIGTPSEIFHENLSSLFKRDNLNSQIFNILTPPLEEEVDSKNTFFEDGGVQDIYGILYFHYIELTLFKNKFLPRRDKNKGARLFLEEKKQKPRNRGHSIAFGKLWLHSFCNLQVNLREANGTKRGQHRQTW